jgi:hypothetical protein
MVILAGAATRILAMGAVTASTLSASIAQPRKYTQADFGGLNSAQVHAASLVKIASNYVDFSHQSIRIRSKLPLSTGKMELYSHSQTRHICTVWPICPERQYE